MAANGSGGGLDVEVALLMLIGEFRVLEVRVKALEEKVLKLQEAERIEDGQNSHLVSKPYDMEHRLRKIGA